MIGALFAHVMRVAQRARRPSGAAPAYPYRWMHRRSMRFSMIRMRNVLRTLIRQA